MWRTWRAAMADALYGPDGFYRRPYAPRAHFRTAAQVSPPWAQCWYELATRVAGVVGPDFAIVEIAAGGGELLAGLAALAPPQWRLLGVEVAPRPDGLPDRVEWVAEPPPSFDGLAIAVEWLDVVPVDVAGRDTDGRWRLVEVNDDGDERLAGPPSADDLAWLRTWAPNAHRAEIGRTRDEAWRAFSDRLIRGVAVAVDYGVETEHDTLTGYRAGRQTRPIPDGSCDLTAHVLFESLGDGVRLSQRDALRQLGLTAERPAYDGDPRAHLDALAATSAAAELIDPHGLGGFSWLVEAKGVALQDCFA